MSELAATEHAEVDSARYAHFFSETKAAVHEYGGPFAKAAMRLGACAVGAGISMAPIAVTYGLSNASIDTQVAQFPATIQYTGNDESSLRFGVAGSYFVPRSSHGIGMTAQIHGPGNINAYFSSESVKVYSGLFKDPEASITGYEKLLRDDAMDHAKEAELLLGGIGTVAAFATVEAVRARRQKRGKEALPIKWTLGYSLGALAVATMASAGIAKHYLYDDFVANSPTPQLGQVYPLHTVQNTPLEGTYADVSQLRSLADNGIRKGEEYYERGKERGDNYVTNALSELDVQKSLIASPRDGELAIFIQSDGHDNEPMIAIQTAFVRLFNKLYGDNTVSAVVSTGDFGYGTAAEARYYRKTAEISGDAPFFATEGNHDLPAAVELLKNAGVEFGNGEVLDIGGTTMLGMADPRKTEFLGPTTPANGIPLEYDLGKKAREIAENEHPELLIMHECYAAAASVEVEDSKEFIAGGVGQDYRTPMEDGITDMPASFVGCGHWHRDVPFRVIWNSDGSWTVYMELNTAGGAIGDPTFGNFSIPYEPPKQMASFAMLYKNKSSGLITGVQLYKFYPDGTVRVEPRIDVGSSDGQPFTARDLLEAEYYKNPPKSGPPASSPSRQILPNNRSFGLANRSSQVSRRSLRYTPQRTKRP